MSISLLWQAIIKVLSGILLLGFLLFFSAGTFDYWQAWLLMGILFIPIIIVGFILMLKNPELLQKRLSMNEEENEQKMVILFSGLLFISVFVISGVCRRFECMMLPPIVTWVSAGLFTVGYLLYAEVLKENTYLSRIVEVQENQKVIDTGLYALVRHPMYMATILLFFSMPLILGSIPSFLLMFVYLPIIAKRIRNEEEVLEEGLAGYKEYKKKVLYKMIPFIW